MAKSVQPLASVLIADDEHLVASGLASSIASLDLKVIGPVPDGGEAIEAARAHRPDLAVLDIRMPVLTGLEAAGIIWDEMQIPCVIVSAYSDESYVAQAQQAGVFGFLLKPVTKDSLRVCLKTAWARAQAEHDMARTIDRLEDSLVTRRYVEQAKWKLIAERNFTESEAHQHLQKAARNSRRPLREIAMEILGIAEQKD